MAISTGKIGILGIDMEEGELDEEDFDTIMKKVTEAVSAPFI